MRLFLGGGGVFTLYYVTAHPGLVPRPVLFWCPCWITVEDLALDPKTCNTHWCFLSQQFEDACHLPASSSCHCEKFSSWRLVYLSTGQKICWLGSWCTPKSWSRHWASLGECQPKGAVIPELKPLSSAAVCPPPLWARNRASQGVLISSNSESGFSSHIGWKGKDTRDWKTTSLFMTEDVTAFTKCQGKPFPGSVF